LLADGLADWLIDWLVDWLGGWLIGWLAGWLVGRLIGWLIGFSSVGAKNSHRLLLQGYRSYGAVKPSCYGMAV